MSEWKIINFLDMMIYLWFISNDFIRIKVCRASSSVTMRSPECVRWTSVAMTHKAHKWPQAQGTVQELFVFQKYISVWKYFEMGRYGVLELSHTQTGRPTSLYRKIRLRPSPASPSIGIILFLKLVLIENVGPRVLIGSNAIIVAST